MEYCSDDMDFDDALRHVGEWGKYQRRFYLMVSLPTIFKGFQVMLVVFTVYVPKHRCAVPGLLNDTWDIVNEDHRQLVLNSIPSYIEKGEVVFDQCNIYTDYNVSVNGQFEYDDCNMSASELCGNDTRPTEACSRWVYDQSELDATLITKFDLVCEKRDSRAHSNMMMMAGFLVGSTMASVLCDWVGRKRIYCLCLVIMIAFGIASAFPTSPEVLLVFRFFSGMGLMGVMVSGFVLAVELIGGRTRTMLGIAWQIVWLVGPFILAGLSYVVRDWRHLQLAGSLPPIIFLVYWWTVPESPRWLVSRDRVDEAVVTLTKVAHVNGKSMPTSLTEKLKEGNSQKDQGSTVSPLVIFKYPVLFIRWLIISFNWGVISMTYYGLSLNVANFSGGVRVNFLASCVGELLGYGAAVLLLDRYGRKKVHTVSMLTAGFSCLFTIFTVLYAGSDLQWITTTLAMIGKLGVSCSFSIIFLYSAELYPTVLRNFGVGCGSMFARMGSMLSPYIADLALYVGGEFGAAVPLIVFGALAVSAGLSSLVLPETFHRKLPETVLDAVNFGRVSTYSEAFSVEEDLGLEAYTKEEVSDKDRKARHALLLKDAASD